MRLVGALALLGILSAYAIEKRRSGKWGEMLFGCHVASALVAVGLVVESRWLVAGGAVFFAGVGIPAWIVRVVASRTTGWLEVAAHVVPMAAATPFVADVGVPRGAGLAAWVAFLALQALSRVTTDPTLNVNLAHGPSPELARFVRSPTWALACVAVASLAALSGAEHALRALVS